jgi:hypothetical protein
MVLYELLSSNHYDGHTVEIDRSYPVSFYPIDIVHCMQNAQNHILSVSLHEIKLNIHCSLTCCFWFLHLKDQIKYVSNKIQ